VLCRVPHLLDHQSAENRRQTENSVGHRSYQAQNIIKARNRNQTSGSQLKVSSNHQIQWCASYSSRGIYRRLGGCWDYGRGAAAPIVVRSIVIILALVARQSEGTWLKRTAGLTWSRNGLGFQPPITHRPLLTSTPRQAYKMSCLSG
jgi:hypothetical protein